MLDRYRMVSWEMGMIPDVERINAQLMKASVEVNVATVCRVFGISRSVFYYRKKRYERYGLLKSLSKRPKHTRMTSQEVVAKITDLTYLDTWVESCSYKPGTVKARLQAF